jgi:tetratricopeptide (TPR) repeat protein
MGPAESKVKERSRAGPLIKDWEIQLHTWPRKLIAIGLVLLTCGTLIYRTWWLFLAAWITRANKTEPAIYERAIQYDPNNADYHFVLAQIYNYSTQHLNISRAGEEYETAVRLNPYRSNHWLELSKYYEQQKNFDRARYAMKMTLERDPNWAQTHWAAANLYIRLDDLKAADFELRRTADLDVSYLTQILDLVWRFYEDPDRIMSTHVPSTHDANLTALKYFVTQKNDRGASLAWSKLKTFETKRQERFAYIDYLVAIGKPHDAWNTFTFPSVETGNLIFNHSFETEPTNGGFDWRFASTEHAEARRDTTTSKNGMSSWLVSFDGKENLDYSGLGHWIPVKKGNPYKLSFWMKTEAISTNEGMYIELDGQTSEKQLGTTYWQQFTIPFTASSDLVTIHLRRVPSKKFDNLLKGKVWVDDFELK